MVYAVDSCLAESSESDWGTKYAVASEAVATPKLMDICCIVLAIVLALLVCWSEMSA